MRKISGEREKGRTMLMATEKGNLEQVRAALEGITGVVAPERVVEGPNRYLVVTRFNRELDTVDSFRRNKVRSYWPSYEELVVSRRSFHGHPLRRLRRVGLIPGYVFSEVDPARDFTGMLDRIVGALDIVRTFSGAPLVIHDADIVIIRKIEAGLNTPRPDKIAHDFKAGEKVWFVDDLIGRWPPGRIVKLAPDGRISIEVDMMGRKLPITALPFQIERM